MGVCPKCGAVVGHLFFTEERQECGVFERLPCGGYFFTATDTVHIDVAFTCPECDEIVTRDEYEAEGVLEGDRQGGKSE